jgi:hypothetical protein
MHPSEKLLILPVLVVLACAIQGGVCARAVVTAQDSVRYVALAQRMEQDGLLPSLRACADQPLYPLAVAAVHAGLPKGRAELPTQWLRCAQLVAATSVVVSIFPLYWLLRTWLGWWKAGLGMLLYICLPEVARLGGDGLADGLGLLFCVLGMAAVARFVSARCPWSLAASGVFLALALLTSSVALLVIVGSLGALVGLAWSDRANWRRAAGVQCGIFVAGWSLVWFPYLTTCGAWSPSQLLSRVIGRHQPRSSALLNSRRAPRAIEHVVAPSWKLADGTPLDFTRKEPGQSNRHRGLGPALAEYGRELAKLMHYWIGLIALWGAWKMRRARGCRVGRFLFFLFVVYSAGVVAHAAATGYLSTRHLLPLVPITLGWAAHGVATLGHWLSRQTLERFLERAWWRRRVSLVGVRLVVAICILPLLPASLAPLHPSRRPHREAGEWLAQHAVPEAVILDTRGWTSLYSGHTTYRHEAGAEAISAAALGYVVVERQELQYPSARSRTLRALLEESGSLVAQFSESEASSAGAVLIYRWDAGRFAARHSSQIQ